MMEIINKSHRQYSMRSEKAVTFYFKINQIYFSALCVREFSLTVGRYVHFVCDFDRFYIIINDDATGFRLSSKVRGIKIYSQHGMELIRRKMANRISDRRPYPVRECVNKINDSLTLEVLLNKRL